MTDLHITAKAPAKRKDVWPDVSLAKLWRVCEIAAQLRANYIVAGGDWFHTPRPAISILARVVQILRYWRIPFFSTIGNHDIVGYLTKGYVNLGLGLLEKAGVVKILRRDGQKLGAAWLKPYHYEAGIDTVRALPSLAPQSFGGARIVLPHSFVTDESKIFDHVRWRDVETDADIVLCSHYHAPQKPKKVNGTVFIAPGAMVRREAVAHDLNRLPKVVEVDIGATSITVEEHVLTWRHSSEVFDLLAIESASSWKQSIDRFLEATGAFSAEKGLDLRGRIQKLGRQRGVDKDVMELVMEKVERHERSTN